jgi:hypothetical protein
MSIPHSDLNLLSKHVLEPRTRNTKTIQILTKDFGICRMNRGHASLLTTFFRPFYVSLHCKFKKEPLNLPPFRFAKIGIRKNLGFTFSVPPVHPAGDVRDKFSQWRCKVAKKNRKCTVKTTGLARLKGKAESNTNVENQKSMAEKRQGSIYTR